MAKPFYEMPDSDLVIWSGAFSEHLTATPLVYHISAEMAASYAALNTAFVTALNTWRNNSTRTPVAMGAKSAARDNLLAMAKYLVNTINSNPLTTDEQREELNIPIRKKPSYVPPPDSSPMVDVIAVNGRTVTLGLHSNEPGKRGKPAAAAGASVFTFVGAEAPTDPAMWKFEGLITKTKFDLSFDASTVANTAWVTANWYNNRGETGVACDPVSINLPASAVLPQSKGLKIAA